VAFVATTKKGSTTKKAGGASKGLAQTVQPDDQLAKVVGDTPLPRTELTKKLWDYIKKNNLQDEKNRRMINADDKLLPIFNGKKQVSMFEMTALVNKHVK
jgi:chromatin remodeling complex protein RSC6